METIEKIIAKTRGKYCFGDNLTVADVVFAPQIQGSIARFGVDASQYPNIWEVYQNLKDI